MFTKLVSDRFPTDEYVIRMLTFEALRKLSKKLLNVRNTFLQYFPLYVNQSYLKHVIFGVWKRLDIDMNIHFFLTSTIVHCAKRFANPASK